jgi:oligopeptidase B
MRSQIFGVLAAVFLCGCKTTTLRPVAPPPVADKIPHVTEIHGERLVDNYFWLRQRDHPRVKKYLEAENAYTRWFMKPTEPLQQTLYREMLSHIQETDSTVPYRDGDYFYYSRTEQGKQYPILCRNKGSVDAPEQITLDLNAMATGKKFLALGVHEISDDGNLLAFSTDEVGFREYTLFVKDLRTGQLLTEKIPHVVSAAWAADNTTIFYVIEDKAKRPYRLYRHRLGERTDELVYEEKDEMFDAAVARTRSKRFIFLALGSKTTDEVRFVRADRPGDDFAILAPRIKDQEYSVDHGGDVFFVRVNDRGRNFRLVTAPVDAPGRQNWREIVPQRDDVMIDDVEVFADFYVMQERQDGLPQLTVTELATGGSRRIEFPEAAYTVGPGMNAEFQTTKFRFNYESLTTPESAFDYEVPTGERKFLKQQPVPGYDASQYESERIFATAPDGVRIPIALVYRKGMMRDGNNPLWLYGYGAYGIPADVWFSPSRLSLLDRGLIVAIAQVRGGGEFGKKWHDAGRMMNKRNTFTDFISCAEHLIREGYTSRDQLLAEGASAGGLLIGAVLNMRPDLFRAVILDVPFVDVINTMLDPTLPLTITEFEEWGDPGQHREQYLHMKSYSPYDNIAPQNYAAMLVETSLNDSQVMFWEPAKYVAKLRATKTDKNPLVLNIKQAGGHSGESGRYDQLRERAFDYAFGLTELGIIR